MSEVKFVKAAKIILKTHPVLNERWVHDRIKEDPSILGLGELELKDTERRQAGAGRLDLLLQDPDAEPPRRYEVEVQLGATDESHIIRTIEYWDWEKKILPQYDHCAVIVAEEITSRFFNVIGLFNGFIPLIAIQMNALVIGEQIALTFTKVLDERRLALIEEDERLQPVTDRSHWESQGSEMTVRIADALIDLVRSFAPSARANYTKHYIGPLVNDQPINFAIFRPRKVVLVAEIKLEQSEETRAKLEEAGIDLLTYDKQWGNYRVRLREGDVEKHAELLTSLLQQAYMNRIA